jgi:hypothetical protein
MESDSLYELRANMEDAKKRRTTGVRKRQTNARVDEDGVFTVIWLMDSGLGFAGLRFGRAFILTVTGIMRNIPAWNIPEPLSRTFQIFHLKLIIPALAHPGHNVC